MTRWALCGLLALVGCRDWERFSRGVGEDCRPAEDSTCPGPELVCDGFEGELSGRWSVSTTGGGTVAQSNGCSYRGEGAVRAESGPAVLGGDGSHAQLLYRDLAAPAPLLSMRLFVRLDPVLEPGVSLAGFDAPGGDEIQIRSDAGVLEMKNTATGTIARSDDVIEADAWTCLELEVTAGEGARAWIEDREPPIELSEPPSTLIDRIHIGPGNARPDQDGPGQAGWYDELVIDDAHVGCAR